MPRASLVSLGRYQELDVPPDETSGLTQWHSISTTPTYYKASRVLNPPDSATNPIRPGALTFRLDWADTGSGIVVAGCCNSWHISTFMTITEWGLGVYNWFMTLCALVRLFSAGISLGWGAGKPTWQLTSRYELVLTADDKSARSHRA